MKNLYERDNTIPSIMVLGFIFIQFTMIINFRTSIVKWDKIVLIPILQLQKNRNATVNKKKKNRDRNRLRADPKNVFGIMY